MPFFDPNKQQPSPAPPSTNEPQGFTIHVKGESTGETWDGAFKAKPKLTHRDSLRRDQWRRELIGSGLGVDAGSRAANIAEIFSKVWVHLVEAPKWWTDNGNGLDLIDEAPAVAVYENIIRIEKEAYEALAKEAEAAKAELQKTAEKK